MASTTDLDYDLLPESVRELADTIGLDAAHRLIEAYGGTRLYVPASIGPGHSLIAALGPEAAAALVEIYGGDTIDVPRAHAAARAALHREIVAAYADGASAAQLARAYGCTERWIYVLAARRRDEMAAQQGDLF